MFTKDTIRLVVQFRDFNCNVVHPKDITLTIYNMDETLLETISSGITLDGDNYYYDYVTNDSDFIFEFKGVYNDKPILARKYQKVKFY